MPSEMERTWLLMSSKVNIALWSILVLLFETTSTSLFQLKDVIQ